MLDTNKTKAFDIIASVYMFWKLFQIITINHRRHERPMPLCRQMYLYNRNRIVTYLEIGFPSWTKAKDSPYRIRDSLARATGSERINPLDRQGRSTDVDYYAWTLRLPALWGVNEPTNDSIGPGSSDQTEAPRNSNNHIGENNINVSQFKHWHHPS